LALFMISVGLNLIYKIPEADNKTQSRIATKM